MGIPELNQFILSVFVPVGTLPSLSEMIASTTLSDYDKKITEVERLIMDRISSPELKGSKRQANG